ncbi:MAG TPA: hypothetical protein VD993_15795 [Chitinophagaceae bacterium]|nr:hypothetical protein [Chitinophagaceae bacterium]
MKAFIFLLIFSTMAAGTTAQVITYDDFRSVIPLVQKEDYKGAFEKTSQLLSSTQNDSSDFRGIVTYMNIFSAAGMVSLQQMTHDEFAKNAAKYIGQWIVMSAHPCIDSSERAFNSLKFVTREGRLWGMTTTSNNDKTAILCFEYFDYTDEINPSEFIGKTVRCGGVLKSVETNPNKSTIWISRLYIANAFARAAR